MKKRAQNVLYVDDDKADLLSFRVAFGRASESHVLKQASSISSALEILQTFRPDLILIDLQMPDSNDTVGDIKHAIPPGCSVVVLTDADPAYAARRAHGYRVASKSRSPNRLIKGGAMIRAAAMVADHSTG